MAQLPVDLDGLGDLAIKVITSVRKFAKDNNVPDFIGSVAAVFIAGNVLIIPLVVVIFIQGLLGIGQFFATTVMRTVAAARTSHAEDFNAVVAAALSESLGTEISPDDIPSGKGTGASNQRNRAVGNKVHDVLTSMMGGLREIQPQDGADNARSFTGFGLNFAISNAFIGILGELTSIGLADNFRELGEDAEQALSLGRLQRLALQPLIRNMIQQPYDLYLRNKTRPDRLSDQQYVHGFHHGDFDETFLRAKLAEKGYPDAEIDRLILELTTHLAEADILRLIRYGDITQDEGVKELNVQGIPEVTAQRLLRATEISRADNIVSSYVNLIEKQFLSGFIDQSTFQSLLNQVPWTEEEKNREVKFVGQTLEYPQTTLTFTQVKAGIVGGILDFDYLDQWLLNQGYSDEDQLYLEYEVLQVLDKTLSKQEITDAKAARGAARAFAPRVVPTITRS